MKARYGCATTSSPRPRRLAGWRLPEDYRVRSACRAAQIRSKLTILQTAHGKLTGRGVGRGRSDAEIFARARDDVRHDVSVCVCACARAFCNNDDYRVYELMRFL